MRSKAGLLGDLLIGVIGALIGGILFDLLGLPSTYGLTGSLVTAVVGAVILLLL